MGSSGSYQDDAVTAVAIDNSDNVIVTGYFTGTANFGGDDLTAAGTGGTDIFLARYTPAGVHLWSQRFGGTHSEHGYGVAIDADDNIFLTGDFGYTVSFGGSPLTAAGSQEDIFLAKYNSSGVHQWSQRFGSTSSESGNSVAISPTGDVVVTGAFRGPTDFGGGTIAETGGQGFSDVFIAKYNTDGLYQWSLGEGGNSNDTGRGVAVDGSGNVVVAGDFTVSISFSGNGHMGAGGLDAFVVKYDPNGLYQWSRIFGGGSDDFGRALALSETDHVTIAGSLGVAGVSDAFLARFDPSGVHQWSQYFSSPSGHEDVAYSIAIDGSDNAIISGAYHGQISSPGTPMSGDVFLAKYGPGGALQWSNVFDYYLESFGYAVAVNSREDTILGGSFEGSLNFGSGSLASQGFLAHDVFLTTFGAKSAPPSITSIEDIANDQGRSVAIQFERSGHDHPSSYQAVWQYEAYRRLDPPPSYVPPHTLETLSSDELMAAGWTQVATIPASDAPSYILSAPTIGDSTVAEGPYYSTFYIRASTMSPFVFFDSAVDSGYSLDNLAPDAPVNVSFSAGQLDWDASAAPDFDYFSVYGSITTSFDNAVLVNYTVGSSMDVSASSYAYYFVSATDFSGNESAPTGTSGATGIDDAPAAYVLSVSNHPNPFNPRTTLRYTVPGRGPVSISIHDARGARVATLLDRVEHTAGTYSVQWDGRNEGGSEASSGIYFARIEQNAMTRTRKLVLVK